MTTEARIEVILKRFAREMRRDGVDVKTATITVVELAGEVSALNRSA
jgi:hypothetical protein